MTFVDMIVIKRHVTDLVSRTDMQLPVMLSKEHARVDIDATGLCSADARALVDRLAQSLGRKGYLWDVWMNTASGDYDQVIHVAEKEEG